MIESTKRVRCACSCGCQGYADLPEDLCHYCLEHHEDLRKGCVRAKQTGDSKPVSMEVLRKALDKLQGWLIQNEKDIHAIKDLFSVFQQDYDKMKKNWAKDRDAMFDYLTEAEELKRELKSIKTNNVVVSRKRVLDLLKEYKNVDKKTSSEFWREGARWVIEFIEKELFEASNS